MEFGLVGSLVEGSSAANSEDVCETEMEGQEHQAQEWYGSVCHYRSLQRAGCPKASDTHVPQMEAHLGKSGIQFKNSQLFQPQLSLTK